MEIFSLSLKAVFFLLFHIIYLEISPNSQYPTGYIFYRGIRCKSNLQLQPDQKTGSEFE